MFTIFRNRPGATREPTREPTREHPRQPDGHLVAPAVEAAHRVGDEAVQPHRPRRPVRLARVQIRLHDRRDQLDHPHRRAGELPPQRHAERVQRRLRRRVDRRGHERHEAQAAGHIDHPRRRPAQELRQERGRHEQRPLQVHVDLQRDLLRRRLAAGEVDEALHAGVVDERVERREAVGDLPGRPRHRVGVAHVQPHRHHAGAAGGHALQLGEVAAADDDGCAAGVEGPRQPRPNARAAAGDEDRSGRRLSHGSGQKRLTTLPSGSTTRAKRWPQKASHGS